MRGESMKDKSKKSTYSTTFGVDPGFGTLDGNGTLYERKDNFPGRPYVLFVKDSENFSVENVHMKNSATWTFRIFRSQYVFVRGIKIYAPHQLEQRRNRHRRQKCGRIGLHNRLR